MKTLQNQKQWHVIYVKSRAEKKVAQELTYNNTEYYLPLQKKLRQWKDRKKWVEMPLLPGYCFVNITRKEYDKVLQMNNVVCYLTFEGRAAIVSEQELDTLKKLIQEYDVDLEVNANNFQPGTPVEIIQGAMVGLKGELREIRGKHKFALHIEQISTTFLVEIPASYLSIIPESVII